VPHVDLFLPEEPAVQQCQQVLSLRLGFLPQCAGEMPTVLTLQRIQQPLRGISFFRRRSSCSLTGKASFSKGSGSSLAFARGLCAEASSGGARGSTVYGVVAVCTSGGLLA
jgi:hypothetical protein